MSERAENPKTRDQISLPLDDVCWGPKMQTGVGVDPA
jgi:hypothetical protein